jgi:hypothetical protein
MNSVFVFSNDNCVRYTNHSYIKERYCYWVTENVKTHFQVFYSWGFTSFDSVKTIVKRFYPEVNEKELLELYQLKVIREDVLKYVHYTYQILNV